MDMKHTNKHIYNTKSTQKKNLNSTHLTLTHTHFPISILIVSLLIFLFRFIFVCNKFLLTHLISWCFTSFWAIVDESQYHFKEVSGVFVIGFNIFHSRLIVIVCFPCYSRFFFRMVISFFRLTCVGFRLCLKYHINSLQVV